MSHQIKVLVVDADEAFRESITNLLLICGVDEFELASTPEEAAEKISEASFDIIFSDLFMPGMGGLQFAEKFQKQLPTTKIIVLIEDDKLPALKDSGHAALNFPTILKSFVSRTLPLLLQEEANSK